MNGVQITTSQLGLSACSASLISFAKATPSCRFSFIFQLPATIFFLIVFNFLKLILFIGIFFSFILLYHLANGFTGRADSLPGGIYHFTCRANYLSGSMYYLLGLLYFCLHQPFFLFIHPSLFLLNPYRPCPKAVGYDEQSE